MLIEKKKNGKLNHWQNKFRPITKIEYHHVKHLNEISKETNLFTQELHS